MIHAHCGRDFIINFDANVDNTFLRIFLRLSYRTTLNIHRRHAPNLIDCGYFWPTFLINARLENQAKKVCDKVEGVAKCSNCNNTAHSTNSRISAKSFDDDLDSYLIKFDFSSANIAFIFCVWTLFHYFSFTFELFKNSFCF